MTGPLQFINFDFMTGDQEIKDSILVEFEIFSRYFVLVVHISLRSSLLVILSSYFKIKKQALRKLQATIMKTRYFSRDRVRPVNFI